jgi:hypothetical protein
MCQPFGHAALYSAGAVLAAALVAEFFMRARLLRPARNNAKAALLTASGRARLLGRVLARAVAPQSSASGGLIAEPIPVRLKTGPLLGEHMLSDRSGHSSMRASLIRAGKLVAAAEEGRFGL